MRFPRPRTLVRATLAGVLAATVTSLGVTTPAQADQVTPGNFTGYGFDQCLTPSQKAMNKWMKHSPFSAVGIYISGDSRWCRDQPNLTPTWVTKQLKNGWRLLPITLGPQANCLDRFPRYNDDEVIKGKKKNTYAKARKQARQEANKAIRAARALGIDARSTLWYDLEGFDLGNTKCRESAQWFLHAWTNQLHKHNYVSGVYSSAGSGIKMLDNIRVNGPKNYSLPDRIWVARWNGKANLQAPNYVRTDGWMPHSRVKQYRGGHNETWGGVTINIDSNFMSLGKGSRAKAETPKCKEQVMVSLPKYRRLSTAKKRTKQVKAAQCLLRKQNLWDGPINGKFNQRMVAAAHGVQARANLARRPVFNRTTWVALLSNGRTNPIIKRGSTGPAVRRLQRALTAATGTTVPVTGVFDARTEAAAKKWQSNIGVRASGVIRANMWRRLNQGRVN